VRLLLDTHALLWWFFDDPKLPETAREVIRDPNNVILVSSASAWEIATKHRLGKLPEAEEAVQDLPQLLRKARFEVLPFCFSTHSWQAHSLALIATRLIAYSSPKRALKRCLSSPQIRSLGATASNSCGKSQQKVRAGYGFFGCQRIAPVL
jgi:PIN domain nuclease of toxin-antitoxin system